MQAATTGTRPRIHFDPRDPAIIADPHTAFANLRSTTPLAWNDAGFWIATRYEDVRSIIIDRKNFGQGDFINNIQLYYGQDFDVFAHSSYRWLSEVFVYQDPPKHTRIRGLVSKALTAKRVREMRPDVEAITHRLLDRFVDRQSMELIHDFAYRLPTLVMCNMLGISEEEADDSLLDQLNQAIADSFLVLEMRPLDADELALANRQIDFLEKFFKSVFDRRRTHPQDDLATALLNAREGDSQLTEREMVTVAIALFGAGFETTAHMIGNGILTLQQYPEQWRKLVGNPNLSLAATEEILRYESSLIATYRTAFHDTDIGGQTVKAGERVLAVLAAGNRDPEVFPKPDEFDIDRSGAHHLAFGGGIHFCVGAELARLEGDVALRALAERFPDLRADTNNPQWRPGFLFRGLEQLQVSW
ncbi:cytochrome P450 [Kineobactrum sediminis]|uniref:Cytochrome P450 n=2 Tax=Kineobactrum sediminis TaxID=1905677 RepID=A0A2N5Y7R7_9GAMM|nr:cytochrome P450 [Kineobactrum sediminis]